eukprot:1158274-Pelagomonas_calceolata.AAC.63
MARRFRHTARSYEFAGPGPGKRAHASGQDDSPGPVYDPTRSYEAILPGKAAYTFPRFSATCKICMLLDQRHPPDGREIVQQDWGFGPSSYAQPPAVELTNAASYSLFGETNRPRRASSHYHASEGPGPGSYTQPPVVERPAGFSAVSDCRSQPAYTMQGKPFFSRAAAQPGPSDYSVRDNITRRSAPAASFHGSSIKVSRSFRQHFAVDIFPPEGSHCA